MLNFIIVKM